MRSAGGLGPSPAQRPGRAVRGCGFPQQELLSLAVVWLPVSALASQEGEVPATALAHAVNLDMHDWWIPTAAGYFEHVSKAKALEAVQVFAPDQVNRLGKLKKAEIASEAERLAAGTGWLPVMFRGVDVPVAEMPVVSATDAEDAAEIADHEEEHALA
jgi:ParB family chromosome partitioning protein